MTDKMITTGQFARWCSCDAKTIHNWTKKYNILHVRTPGGHKIFKPSVVREFLVQYGYDVPKDLDYVQTHQAAGEGSA